MRELDRLDKQLADLRLTIGDLEEEWETMLDEWDHLGNILDVKDELIPLIINTHAAMEDMTAHVIVAYVIRDSFSDDAFDYIYSQMSQHHRETLLVECNILSNKTRGKMGEFRGLRNKVAHGANERLDWYRDNIPERMNYAFEVLDKLDSAFTDEELRIGIFQGEAKI